MAIIIVVVVVMVVVMVMVMLMVVVVGGDGEVGLSWQQCVGGKVHSCYRTHDIWHFCSTHKMFGLILLCTKVRKSRQNGFCVKTA